MATVLLVEDSEQIWDFLARRLQRKGHTVHLAHDGEASIEKARSVKPDVILLDMNLPVMDGWTAARALKSDEALRAIPIIAMTAHAMAGDREKTLDAGCDDYHPKPIDFARLISQIETAVAKAEGKADAKEPN